MLANHVYWNLGAFATPEASTVLNNTLHMPYSARAIVIDSIEVPTGALEVVAGTPLDFTSPKTIGRDIADAHQCGFNCTGYDNSFILDRPRYSNPEVTDISVLTLSSDVTGIQMDVRTNQRNLQVYTCNFMAGTIPVKEDQQHGAGTTFVPKYGCVSCVFSTLCSEDLLGGRQVLNGFEERGAVDSLMLTMFGFQIVIETQQWIDAINYPEWGQDAYQIFTVDSEPAVVWAQYDFSIVKS